MVSYMGDGKAPSLSASHKDDIDNTDASQGEPERKRLSRKCEDSRNRIQMQIAQGAIELYLHYTSSNTVRSSSNENSSEAEQAREATSSADTEMSSFQFSSSSRPSEEQHTPSLAQETLLQPDLDNSEYVSPLQTSST